MDSLNQNTYKEFFDILIKGDHLSCSRLIHSYFEKKIPPQIVYEKIIKKALYEIGELWENNKISVATEHLASAIVESILNELYPLIASSKKFKRKVIVTCIENEYHQIGVRMISDIFEINGWNSFFLGANTPSNELISYTKTVNPDLLAISLSIYFHLPTLEKLITKIRQEFPELSILVGGQAFRHGGQQILNEYKNIIYKPDINSVELLIKEIS